MLAVHQFIANRLDWTLNIPDCYFSFTCMIFAWKSFLNQKTDVHFTTNFQLYSYYLYNAPGIQRQIRSLVWHEM